MAKDDEGTGKVFAVLVDGDNAHPSLLSSIVDEVGRYGTLAVRRIYGDWASGRLNGWTEVLHEFAFQPVQQHSYVSGKNATDSRLIIDAMDLLHTSPTTAFCIVSSDSDYTGLAKRLREASKFVVGVGERKTPIPFVKACDQFVYTDLLTAQERAAPPARRQTSGRSKSATPPIAKLLVQAVEAVQGETGYANLSQVRQWLTQKDPGFDPRSYGRRQLSQLFRDSPDLFEFEKGTTHHVRVREQE